MADIFISYASEDRSRIEPLVAAIEEAGHSVWWDRHIDAGSEFSETIEAELNSAAVVIVAWSKSANKSPWVRDEASLANEQNKLVPICLDTERPPMGFRQYQALDLSSWGNLATHPALLTLLDAIRAKIDGGPAPSIRAANSAVASPRRFSWQILGGVGGLVVAIFLGVMLWPPGQTSESRSSATTNGEITALLSEPAIHVEPIKVQGTSQDLDGFAARLSEDISNGLSRFSYLIVHTSNNDLQTAPSQYKLQGSLVRSGDKLRLVVSLLDQTTHRKIWGETFDRQEAETDLLALQDDLADIIVASVADPYGALSRSLTNELSKKDPEDYSAYDAVLRHFVYRQRLSVEDHLVTRDILESAVEQASRDANIWAALAAIYIEEVKHGYNVRPDAGDRALNAAKRAIELDPHNAAANFAIAEVYYFQKNIGAFKATAERAISLNPRDSDALAMIGILYGYSGEWQRALDLTTRALELNPNHPGWYRFSRFFYNYHQGEYEAALEEANLIGLPSYFPAVYARAITHAELGDAGQSHAEIENLRALWSDFDKSFHEKHLDVWMYAQPTLIEEITSGFAKAGVEIH